MKSQIIESPLGYGHYYQHGARRVKSTKGTVLWEYEIQHEVRSLFPRSTRGTEYEGYGFPGVRVLAQGTTISTSTEYERYEIPYEHP